MSPLIRYCCIAHWLFVPFLETSRVSGNTNPLVFLIIITMIINNSAFCCSSIKLLHFDLLSSDGRTTTKTIFMCHLLLFSVLLVRLNWQVYCRDSFQLLSFLPDSKEPFCNTVSFSGKVESSAGLTTLPVLPGVSQS